MSLRAPPKERSRRPARIVIVDDHPAVRLGLRELLSHEPDLVVCGEAEDVEGGLVVIESTRPDLVVVDISLRESNGLDLIRRLQEREDPPAALVASVHDADLYAGRALAAGARGYVHKSCFDAIADAIRRVLEGGVYLSGES